MSAPQLHLCWTLARWIFATAIVVTVAGVYHHRGRISGENGVGYWQGWQDAMIQTEYGKKPYNSEEPLWQKD